MKTINPLMRFHPSFGAFAAGSASASQTQNLHKIGVVLPMAPPTLDGLKLNWLKSRRCWRKRHNITSAVGNDKMSGTGGDL
ncbi:hypothetical protein KCP76_18290 [Salmonella enterica subsp. enterica serovar Weltevreden]|nr:hypothetical protein KCP76_18290 [Salmonella enterica subsp. enterica serovar Weltevreden]